MAIQQEQPGAGHSLGFVKMLSLKLANQAGSKSVKFIIKTYSTQSN